MIKLKFKNLNFFMNRKLDNRLNIIFVFPGLGSFPKEYEYFSDSFYMFLKKMYDLHSKSIRF